MKMKKSLNLVASIGLILVLTALLLVAAPTLATAKELSLSLHFGPKVGLVPGVYKPLAEQIEKATNGRVKVKIYYGGTLAKVKDAYNAVVKGIADMTYTQQAHTPGQFPLVHVIALPFMTPSTEVSTKVFHELYKKFPEIRKEHDNVHVLWLWSSLPIEIHTAKKPVRKLEDLKGMKIATQASVAPALQALGAVPVVMGTPAFYPSLEKGVVDGASLAWGAWKGWKIYEVTKYHTNCHISTWPCVTAMNKNTWNSFSPDLQAKISCVASNGAVWHVAAVNYEKNQAYKIARKGGHEIFELSPAEFDRWKARARPAWNKWASKMDAKGLPGRALLDETIKLVDKYKGQWIRPVDLLWQP